MEQTSKHPVVEKVKYVSEMKFLLILGIVLAHSNLAGDFPPEVVYASAGLQTVNFISGKLMPECIPVFFFLSGYLFFWNCDTFDSTTYFRKLRSRLTTLLVSYLIWCTICAGIMYLKCRYLDFPGRGIFLADNKIDILNFLKGYWAIPQADGMPFADAFWFIRNLMVFVVLSPVFWFIGRRWWLTLAVLIGCLAFSDFLYGAVWFMLGACAGCYRVNLPEAVKPGGGKYLIISLSVWAGATWVAYHLYSSSVLTLLACTSWLIAVIGIARGVAKYMDNRLLRTSVHATFFIYAFHQCFCFRLHRLWIHLIGIETFWTTMATYISTFLSIVVICLVGYVVMRKFAPRLLSVMTGGR